MELYQNSSNTKPLLFFETFITNDNLKTYEDMFFNFPLNPSQVSSRENGYIEYFGSSYKDCEPIDPVREYFKDYLKKLLDGQIFFTTKLLIDRKDELEYQNIGVDVFINKQLKIIEILKGNIENVTVCKELVIEALNILEKNIIEIGSIQQESPKKKSRIKTNNPFFEPEISRRGIIRLYDLAVDYRIIDDEEVLEETFINDDYVKFIRFSQHFIEKNGSGILAFINPHGYLDNPTFRGMRWNLLKTYDKIYTIDLHGNALKKETSPDGSADVNVFDIMQGVSINIFVKTGKKKANELGSVFHYDLYGKREFKYDFLSGNSLKNIDFKELQPEKPNYFFVPNENKMFFEYNKGFDLNSLFKIKNTGVCSQRDSISMQNSESELKKVLNDFEILNENEIRNKYKLSKDGRDWKINLAKNNVLDLKSDEKLIKKIHYRLFDLKTTFYSNKSKGFIAYPRYDVFKHLLRKDNLCFLMNRCVRGIDFNHVFISKYIPDLHLFETANASIYGAPLYLYPETNGQLSTDQTTTRIPNLNTEIVNKIAKQLGLTFVPEKELEGNVCMANNDEVRPEFRQTLAPIDVLDYIYAVLHSPTYREKYKEFLKIDFPKIPYPKDSKTFWQLVALGSQIRQIHLLESAAVEEYITEFNIDGDCVVRKPSFVKVPNFDKAETGNVFINETQYFENVPEVAWNFYIGGYQPAQKWLKDRKDRKLEFDDIAHYQKIIVALFETDRLMKKINTIDIE